MFLHATLRVHLMNSSFGCLSVSMAANKDMAAFVYMAKFDQLRPLRETALTYNRANLQSGFHSMMSH